MRNIFDLIMQQAQKDILNASDKDLSSDKFENSIYNKMRIQSPYLDMVNISVKINKEIITLQNAPEGINFINGQEMECALFYVHIIGPMELFNNIINNNFLDRSCFIKESFFYYKEFSSHHITGNNELINTIKTKAKGIFDGIQNRLDQFKQIAELFNENELKLFIITTIEKERKSRNDKRDAEIKLKQF